MGFKDPSTAWVASLFDTTWPSPLYLVVLPALIMFALGFRNQALIFTLGAVAVLAIINNV